MEIELLNLICELHSLESNLSNWKIENFKNTPPKLFRLKKIIALLDALSIKCGFEDFFRGKHLNNQYIDQNILPQYFESLGSIVEELSFEDKKQEYLYLLFHLLLKYKLNCQKVLDTNSGLYAVSGYLLLEDLLVKTINKKLEKMISPVDNLLHYLINPLNCQISKKDLIKNYNYPDINLEEIDLDWM